MSSFPRRHPVGLLIAALLGLLLLSVPHASAATPATRDAGAVNFVKVTSSSFDRYTDAPNAQVSTTSAGAATAAASASTTTFADWMRSKFWRSVVFAGYFDNKNSWYDRGWMYIDSYAIYAGTAAATQQADWILRDAQGNKLYIPWGCSNGTCPQYAADIGNPDYRAWFVSYVKGLVAKGYRGVWLDDVNLDFRVGNGGGASVAPLDPRTGRTMTEAAWRGYFATLTEQLRAALPGVEMVHNSIWYAGGANRDANPDVQRQIRSADVINMERGVNDDGLTGGTGAWSLNAYFAFVDRVHALGKSVVFDSYDDSSTEARAYNLGAYFLISQGNDGVGLSSMTPQNWWSMYDADLGAACGARTSSDGIWRRDFAGGTVLLGEPGAATRTVTLTHPMTDESGRSVSSVTVRAKTASILRGTTNCTPTTDPIPAAPTTPTAPATPTAPTTPMAPTPPKAPTTPATPTTPTTPATGTTKPATPTRPKPRSRGRVRITKILTVVRKRTAAKARASRVTVARRPIGRAGDVLVSGRASGLAVNTLHVTLKRRVGSAWQRSATATVQVQASGAWSLPLSGARAGRYEIVVTGGDAPVAAGFTFKG